MANIFLDLGTHFGQGLQQFMQRFNMDESWTIHTFEANAMARSSQDKIADTVTNVKEDMKALKKAVINPLGN